MGTLGLEVNILTPEFGPRVYQGAVLTDVELAADARITEQLCIGETCSRCLYSCPTNAVLHWGLDKRLCGRAAQPDGISAIVYGLATQPDGICSSVYGMLQEIAEERTDERMRKVVTSPATRR